MKVIVSPTGKISLNDELNFGALSTEIPAELSISELSMALLADGWGYVQSDEHCYLFIQRLASELSAVHASEVWLDPFNRMIEFASSRGWLGPDGEYVRAHIERVTTR